MRFIRYEYSNNAAYARWCRGLIRKIRAQNPSLPVGRYELDSSDGFDTDAGITVYRLSRGWNISEEDAARILVRAIVKPFVRLWNRSVNPGAMLNLYTRRNDLSDEFLNDSSLFEDFMMSESDAQFNREQAAADGDKEAAERFRDLVWEAERVNYEAGIGNWRDFVDFSAEQTVGVGPGSFTLNKRGETVLDQGTRKRLRNKLKSYADDIRETLNRPSPLDALQRAPR